MARPCSVSASILVTRPPPTVASALARACSAGNETAAVPAALPSPVDAEPLPRGVGVTEPGSAVRNGDGDADADADEDGDEEKLGSSDGVVRRGRAVGGGQRRSRDTEDRGRTDRGSEGIRALHDFPPGCRLLTPGDSPVPG